MRLYLWLILISVTYGLVILLDPLIYTYITYRLDVDSVYLGICNALWSILYIFSTLCLGFLADRGRVRTLMSISFIASALSWIFIARINIITALLSYTLHAVSIASLNLSLNVLVFENVDSESWGRVLLFSRSLGHIVRGSILILLALANYVNVVLIQQITIVLIAISIISIPSTTIISERSIYRLYGLIRNLGSYLKASTSILYIDKPTVAENVFEKIWYTHPRIGIGRVAAAVMFITSVGEYVLAFVPLMVKDTLNMQSLWMAYGITSITTLIAMLMLRNLEGFSKRLLLILTIFRSLILLLGMSLVKDMFTLTLYLLLPSLLYLTIDVLLYNLFISLTGGYRTSLYYTLRELGSVIGSVLGGLMLSMGTNIYTTITVVLTLLSVTLII